MTGTERVAAVTGAAWLLPPVAWLALRAPPRVGTVLTLLALALAGLARGGAARQALEHGVRGLGDETVPRWIRARVVEHPLREADAPLAIVRMVDGAGKLARGTRVRLRLPAGCDAEWGDTLMALTTLERPPGRTNPGGFAPRDTR